jgi:hypothetical protein
MKEKSTQPLQLGEQQFCSGGLEFLERVDGAGDRLADHPGGSRPGRRVAFALERQAGDLPPVGPSVSVAADLQAAPAQVLDYWREVLIPIVRYSPACMSAGGAGREACLSFVSRCRGEVWLVS